MYEVTSDLPKKEYLAELKGCFGSPFYIFDERMVGIVIGSFFSVAHHTEYEYDRRFNTICNRAWGRVKTNPVDGKTEVTFIRGYGQMSPLWILFLSLMISTITMLTGGFEYLAPDEMAVIYIMGVICALVVCGISTLSAAMSERSAYGAREITKMLEDPKNYFC